jgi:hypothetical protein
MAKKARRKLEEEEEAAFEFPVFDDTAFVKKEFELAVGLTLAGLLAVGIGLIAWGLTVANVPWWGSVLLGLLLTALSPVLLGHARSGSSLYTKGDWAGLILLVFFGYVAIWLLLVNITSHPV